MIALIALALASAAGPSAPCAPLPGAQQLLAKSEIRWVVVGEQHGTNETPSTFANLVCLASKERSVVVAVEQPMVEQAAIDAYLMSDGGRAAEVAFLKSAISTNKFKDGRSSQAYFRLFQVLRRLHAQEKVKAVIAFQPSEFPSAAEFEKLMAKGVIERSPPDTLVLALVGNVHAMRTPVSFSGPAYLPMAGSLPVGQTVTLDVRASGGTQWACMSPTECGPQPIGGEVSSNGRSVVLGSAGGPAYSGILYLGIAATTSPPQVPE